MILVINPAIHPVAQAHAKQSLGRHKKMIIKEWRCPSCKCEFEGPGPAGGQVICPDVANSLTALSVRRRKSIRKPIDRVVLVS